MREAVAPIDDAVAPGDDLLSWAAAGALRDLPWRRTRDPWAVLVAEVMLQQTQVARVVPRWHAFLDAFPDATSCARSGGGAGDVVRLWDGLGYNRRAIALHATAVACVEGHGGTLPDDLGALLALPGIGPYTARAVLVFAYERSVCPLDVNTSRPLARAFGTARQVDADDLVPADGPEAWTYAEALMDLGAVVCRRRAPACDGCPWQGRCAWHLAGHPDPDPAAPAARQSRFAGSDRQGRGRLVAALRRGPVPSDLASVADVCGWPDDPARAARVADSLVADGLAVLGTAEGRDVLALPATTGAAAPTAAAASRQAALSPDRRRWANGTPDTSSADHERPRSPSAAT